MIHSGLTPQWNMVVAIPQVVSKRCKFCHNTRFPASIHVPAQTSLQQLLMLPRNRLNTGLIGLDVCSCPCLYNFGLKDFFFSYFSKVHFFTLSWYLHLLWNILNWIYNSFKTSTYTIFTSTVYVILNISCHLVTIPLHADRNEMPWEENYVTGTLHIYHHQWQHRLGKHLSPLNTVSRLEKQHRACYYLFLQSQYTTLTKIVQFFHT